MKKNKFIKNYKKTIYISLAVLVFSLASIFKYINDDLKAMKNYSFEIYEKKKFNDHKISDFYLYQKYLSICKSEKINCTLSELVNRNYFMFSKPNQFQIRKDAEEIFENKKIIVKFNSLFSIKINLNSYNDQATIEKKISKFIDKLQEYSKYITSEGVVYTYDINQFKIKKFNQYIYLLIPIIIWLLFIMILFVNKNLTKYINLSK